MYSQETQSQATWTRLVAAACVLSFLGAQPRELYGEEVPESEHVQVLRMLSGHSKNTWNGLKTWRGELRIQSEDVYSGRRAERFFETPHPLNEAIRAHAEEFKRITRKSVVFAVDMENDRVFSRPRLDSQRYVDVATNRQFSIDTGRQRFAVATPVSIVADNRLITFDPNMSYGLPQGGSARMAFRYSLTQPADPSARMFGVALYEQAGKAVQEPLVDPRAYLCDARPMWQELELIANAIERTGRIEVDGQRLLIQRSGTGLDEEYRVIFPGLLCPGRYVQKEMTFRAAAGFSITLLAERERGESVRRETRWNYKQQSSLHVPSSVNTKTYDPQSGAVVSQTAVTIVESVVNQPMEADVFSEQNLGLQEGDCFVDKAASRVFKYQSGKLKQLEDTDANAYGPQGG